MKDIVKLGLISRTYRYIRESLPDSIKEAQNEEMDCHIATEDLVYPHDKHGKQYGWGC